MTNEQTIKELKLKDNMKIDVVYEFDIRCLKYFMIKNEKCYCFRFKKI